MTPVRAQAQLAAPSDDSEMIEIGTGEMIGFGAVATGAILASTFLPDPASPNWSGGIAFDDQVRNALRARTERRQTVAGKASDILDVALVVMPFTDAAVAWNKNSGEQALQVALINLESMAVTASVVILTKKLVGRERPFGMDCAAEPGAAECSSTDRYESFLSGHTAFAFTGAGLVCAHHEALDLYGGGFADTAACIAAMAAAGTVGVLRIAADKHYASDVLAGAAVGFLSGYVLPKLLHYPSKGIRLFESSDRDVRFIPTLAPTAAGFILQF